MLTVVEKTGKTVEDALRAALVELNTAEDCVNYEVLETPSKGFLGLIGSKPAKIRVTLKEVEADSEVISIKQTSKPLDTAILFLEDIFRGMNMKVDIEVKEALDGIVLDLHGEDLGILIGKHGQTLDALQYLTNLAANRDMSEEKVRISIDVENYRKRREETLYRLAMRLADKVKRTGDKITLEPMSRHERKVIHMALQDERRILTYSDGEEPFRKVVIALKR
ncbi:RNA-binding cell elongation regulator Jag/EloR [Anaerosinus gibii]|uniref:RNA-binding protein KhpB n=1 Tax=Selenobaculum gibii TaxID=3054208 RepID=A0A9Y2AJ00_9FIRM|nr:RNA-binding cell elongation regulator Jag/EloR [Selenobaculum gbiensis]WIW70747.1 RNA-binding cell elongation regulator Jag/EloR [Selenobaculum gbiensis]